MYGIVHHSNVHTDIYKLDEGSGVFVKCHCLLEIEGRCSAPGRLPGNVEFDETREDAADMDELVEADRQREE